MSSLAMSEDKVSDASNGLEQDVRGGTHAAIEPNDNLLLSSRVRRRLEPKVKLVGPVQVVRDGHLPGVRLANVKVHVRDSRAIDGVLCVMPWSASFDRIIPMCRD